GNPGLLSIPRTLADKLQWSQSLQRRGRARTISGEFDIYEGTLAGAIEFAGMKMDRPVLQVNDRFTWGNLGTAALKNSIVRLDQVNRRLSAVTTTRDTKKTAMARSAGLPRPRYGMALGFGPDSIRVEEVFPGGLAEQGGLRAGDQIQKINDKSIAELNHARIDELLHQPQLSLVVERDGKTVELKLAEAK
ncbi:MAG TPA: PDZ domain-containing protein, partial [Pirellulaceae bacterium]